SYDITGFVINNGDSAHYYFHTVTGIADVAAVDESITVFPNPSGDVLTVSGSVPDELSAIEIFDAEGKMVYSERFPKGDSFMHRVVDVSKLSTGVYFVEFLCGKNVYRRKFVKG
ncbi:MAG: T9SS type A sorting domain-containing protein, partial [Bacteroidota bacterium]